MSTQRQPQKICVICGEDCSGRPRIQDRKGRYYCKDCYEQARQAHQARKQAPVTPTPPQAEEPDAYSLLSEVIDETSPAPRAPAHFCPNCGNTMLAGAVLCTKCGHNVQTGQQLTIEKRNLKRDGGANAGGLVGFIASPMGVGLGVLVVIAVVAMSLGDLVTGLFFLLVGLAALNGYWVGASRISAVFGGMFVAALLAVPLGKSLEGVFSAALGSTGLTNRMISIAVLAIIVVVVVAAILHVLIRQAVNKKPAWKRYDKLIGSGLGLLEGTLLGFLLIWTVLSLEPLARTSLVQTGDPENTPRANPVSQGIVAIAEVARESTVGQVADAVNPLDEMRLITLLEHGLIVLNDPRARDAFVRHPAIAGIKQRPSVQRALDMLTADPQINQIVESEDGISGEGLRAILDSPTLLAILDETKLVADLSPIADEIEHAIDQALEHIAAAKDAVPSHIEALKDRDPNTRRRAANSLGILGPHAAGAVPALIETLKDKTDLVRSAAVKALGKIGPKARAAIPALTETLHDEEPTVRAAAADALKRIQSS